jgi:hypothetical protein
MAHLSPHMYFFVTHLLVREKFLFCWRYQIFISLKWIAFLVFPFQNGLHCLSQSYPAMGKHNEAKRGASVCVMKGICCRPRRHCRLKSHPAECWSPTWVRQLSAPGGAAPTHVVLLDADRMSSVHAMSCMAVVEAIRSVGDK